METSQNAVADSVEVFPSKELTDEQIQSLFEQLKSIDAEMDILKKEKETIQEKIKGIRRSKAKW